MMNPVIRGASIYVFLLIIFRLMGKRTLSEITTFDFVLLLVIGEVTQQALLGNDFSITGSFILITTLIVVDLLFSMIKERFHLMARITEGMPLIIVEYGKPLVKRMNKCKIDEQDVMEAARINLGLERMDQIKYAILEKSGSISIIPYEAAKKM